MLGGYWQFVRHHWLSCPVAYGGSGVYPVLWTHGGASSILGLKRSYVEVVAEAVGNAVASGATLTRLGGPVSKRDSRETSAARRLWAAKPEARAKNVDSLTAAFVRKVLFVKGQ